MTVLTTAIFDEEKKEKVEVEEAKPEDPAFPALKKSKNGVIAVVRNRRAFARSPQRIFLFVITLIGLLCAIGGLCYGIYNFAKLGHANRHRVFCRVIEATPVRRSRIVSEKAELSADGRALQLFNPAFIYARETYSSSVLLVLEKHGITVTKVESRRQCFVKRQMKTRRMRIRVRDRLDIVQWYRRLGESNYFPNLHLSRRFWMARTPHISHIDAGHLYHPKVAEFCKDMKVYRMVEVQERVGVIPYGGGLLPKCPLRKCIPCPGGSYVRDRHGCRTCQCKHRPKAFYCHAICETQCPNGRLRDPLACIQCNCANRRNKRIRTRSVDEAEERMVAEKDCEVIRVSIGLIPGSNDGIYELDEIRKCPGK